MPSIEELTEMTIAFRDARSWKQFHTVKNLLISLNLGAAELLELVQWKDDATIEQQMASEEFRERLSEECADIFIYLLLICRTAKIDLAEAADMTIKRNSDKYPAEKAYSSAKKNTLNCRWGGTHPPMSVTGLEPDLLSQNFVGPKLARSGNSPESNFRWANGSKATRSGRS